MCIRDRFTAADIDVFYSGWNLGARAKGKRLGTLRAFFRFCMNREWLSKNPVSADMKPPMGANRVANKAPYTDEELQRIIDACDQFGSVKWSNGLEQGQVYSGEDLKDLSLIHIWSSPPAGTGFAPAESVITSMAGFESAGSVITPLAGFAGEARPHPPGGRRAIPASFK